MRKVPGECRGHRRPKGPCHMSEKGSLTECHYTRALTEPEAWKEGGKSSGSARRPPVPQAPRKPRTGQERGGLTRVPRASRPNQR